MRSPASTNVPFLEVAACARGALGGVRVVRHHDDRLLELLVQPLQQRQHLARRLRVEVAGRLVGEQQRRIGDDGARDRDALLLPAGQLARIVVRRGRASPTMPSAVITCSRRCFFDSFVSSSGSSTFSNAVSTGIRL